jgi:sugar O-acyltransferase (sialic acid O-acetyltransferase NeuD family)
MTQDLDPSRLVVVGLSEPTLTMILDNLESRGRWPRIHIVNNLDRSDLMPFLNPSFSVTMDVRLTDDDRGCEAFLGVNKPASKRAVVALCQEAGLVFTNIINGSASMSSTAQLGRGVHINSLVSVAAHSTLGDFVSINRNASIGHHTEIGEFVTINPGAHIAGSVRVGRGALIGMGVHVLDGVEIGAESVVGAGSLVTRSIPAGVIAYGSPCRVVRPRDA